MKKISIFIVFLSCFGMMKSQDIASVFTSIPDKMILPVDSMSRLDIVDLYRAGRVAQVVNSFEDTTRMVSLKENSLSLQVGNLRFDLALLPMINDSKIICVIKTVCAPVCDSKVSFYTTEWKELESKIFFTPVTGKWFLSEGTDHDNVYFAEVDASLDMSFMHFTFEEGGLQLVQTYNTPQYLSSDMQKKADKYLKKEPKKFTWNKIKYE